MLSPSSILLALSATSLLTSTQATNIFPNPAIQANGPLSPSPSSTGQASLLTTSSPTLNPITSTLSSITNNPSPPTSEEQEEAIKSWANNSPTAGPIKSFLDNRPEPSNGLLPAEPEIKAPFAPHACQGCSSTSNCAMPTTCLSVPPQAPPAKTHTATLTEQQMDDVTVTVTPILKTPHTVLTTLLPTPTQEDVWVTVVTTVSLSKSGGCAGGCKMSSSSSRSSSSSTSSSSSSSCSSSSTSSSSRSSSCSSSSSTPSSSSSSSSPTPSSSIPKKPSTPTSSSKSKTKSSKSKTAKSSKTKTKSSAPSSSKTEDVVIVSVTTIKTMLSNSGMSGFQTVTTTTGAGGGSDGGSSGTEETVMATKSAEVHF